MLIENKKWVAFFSHTGNEIQNLSRELGRYPDRVVTNRPPDASINKKLGNRVDIVYMSNRPTPQDYNRVIWEDSVVTLHGWMRIIPPDVCKQHTIYNLHPGLITKYPELKGADPQKRVAEEMNENKYTNIGCVIHRVTPGVDEGPVLAESSVFNHYSGEKMITDRLHGMALSLWTDFITANTDEQALQVR